MSRVVTALYDSRAEAETARARLGAESSATNMRILGEDSIGALDRLKIEPREVDVFREALHGGGHLLVAEIARGDDHQIVSLLTGTAGKKGGELSEHVADLSSGSNSAAARVTEEVRIPTAEEELRIGKRIVERGGARVHSVVRESEAKQQVVLRDEHLDVETRAATRRLSDADVTSAGLLKERLVEVSEMREEPVVKKAAFVREEVVLKKTFSERVETVRGTVRHNEVEVEEICGERSARQELDGSFPQEDRRRKGRHPSQH